MSESDAPNADLFEEEAPQTAPASDEQASPKEKPEAPSVQVEGQVNRAHGPSLMTRLSDLLSSNIRSLGYRTLLYSWRLKGSFPLKLATIPEDPWPGDKSKGEAYLDGNYRWNGFERQSASPPFRAENAPVNFLAQLHSFCWLRDVAAFAPPEDAQLFAEAVIRRWIEDFASFHPIAWRADVLGERFIHWTAYAPLILANHDLVYRSKVLNALARQSRHLMRSAAKAADGLPRIKATTGLIYSGLLLPGAVNRQKKGESLLGRELGHFVYADGGVATRSPKDALDVLKLMIGLRGLYRKLEQEVPPPVQMAIDRLVPSLKGLMHPDGNLSAFHGSRPGQADILALALKLSESSAHPTDNGAKSGYQRMACGKSLAIVDAGPPPATPYSAHAHSSVLAFEFSHKKQRIFVNCGSGAGDCPISADLARMTRTTAAHTALVISNINSAQIRKDGLIGRAAESTSYVRQEGPQGIWLEAGHNGYERRVGLHQKRRLFLSKDGLDLRGEDMLSAASNRPRLSAIGSHDVDIRFHLHPDVEATPTQDGEAAILRVGGKSGWMFRARGGQLKIDDSLFIDADGVMQRTKQLVLSAPIDDLPLSINWSLKAMTS